VLSVFFLVKVEVFFIDGAAVMAFSGFFSSVTEDIDTLSPWSSFDLNEPKHDQTKFNKLFSFPSVMIIIMYNWSSMCSHLYLIIAWMHY
jgi:hypothetical protein